MEPLVISESVHRLCFVVLMDRDSYARSKRLGAPTCYFIHLPCSYMNNVWRGRLRTGTSLHIIAIAKGKVEMRGLSCVVERELLYEIVSKQRMRPPLENSPFGLTFCFAVVRDQESLKTMSRSVGTLSDIQW